MIIIKNLVKRYRDHIALNHIDLQVGKGTILGLLGPNGAGKTTLVSILNGLTDFQEGEIEIFGLPLRKNLTAIRRRSAFVPQSLALYDNLTVHENLLFFAGIQKIAGNALRHNLDYAVTTNRLQSMLDQRAGILSGGQKRRLNIAIGLLNNPQVIYFDEPTAGIDPEMRNDILKTIRAFKDDGKTVVYTSHYMQEIETLCDEVAIIDQGQIIRHGLLKDMLEEEKSDTVIIKLQPADRTTLLQLARAMAWMEVVNTTTLKIHTDDGEQVGRVLIALKKENIRVLHIRYNSSSLESLFIRLTSHGGDDD